MKRVLAAVAACDRLDVEPDELVALVRALVRAAKVVKWRWDAGDLGEGDLAPLVAAYAPFAHLLKE
jgi:hypothetical protein